MKRIVLFLSLAVLTASCGGVSEKTRVTRLLKRGIGMELPFQAVLVRLPMAAVLLLATCAGVLLSLPFWLWDRMSGSRQGLRIFRQIECMNLKKLL